jgi:chromosome segregation protein
MLHNFKSFKKGNIEFTKGLNGIIGPNGSGKSTICDAILFVLGENSLSRLRVNKVNKLINDSAKATQPIASVKLEFDGERKTEIKRIIRFDGKTKIYMDGKRVTRKALLDFLFSLGVSTGPMNSITQEEIIKVINMNPKERRMLIDEISGIEEFNAKKEEAQKELEKVEQRLSEANILLNERLGYLKELEKEREQALLYKELEEKIKRLSFALISFDLEENKRNLESLIKQEAEKNLKKEKLEKEILRKKEEIEKIKSLVDEKLKQINVLSLEKQNFFEKKQEIEKEIEVKKYKKSKLEEEIKKLELQKKEIEEKLRKEIENEIEISKEIEKIKEEIKLSDEEIVDEREIEEKRNKLSSEKAKLLLILEEKEEKEESKIDEIEEKIKGLESSIDEKRKEIYKIEKEVEEKIKEKEEVDKKIFEEEIKGKGKVYDFVSKQDGVYGSVGELINFDKKYEKAINACASSRMNYFVVESMDVANRIIKSLNEKRIGRASFIPLKELVTTKRENGSLAEFIDYDKKFEKVINFLFGSTFLEDFEKIKNSPGKRYVTIDGTLVESSCIITGGYIETINFGELKRKQKELQEAIEEKNKEIEERRKEVSTLELKRMELKTLLEYESNRIKSIKEKNEALRKKKEEAKKRISEIEKEEEELKKKKPVGREEIEKRVAFSKLELELKNIKERGEEEKRRIQEIEGELEKIKVEKEKVEEELINLENELKQLKAPEEIEPLYKEYQQLQEKENVFANEIGSIQKELDYLNEEVNRIRIKKAEIEMRTKDLLSEIEGFKEKFDAFIKSEEERKKVEEELENTRRKIQELKNVNFLAIQAYEEKSKEVKEVEEKVERIKEEKEAIIKMIKEIEEKKNRIFRENFEKVNENFKKLYSYIFNDTAELYLDKPREPFSSGLYIKVKKVKRDEESFSGGEKTILFLILLFSIHFVKNLPFYLLDEVDAPLDKENIKKVFELIKKISKETNTQFIIVTHNDLSVKYMDTLVGVTKTNEGSKVYGIDLTKLTSTAFQPQGL